MSTSIEIAGWLVGEIRDRAPGRTYQSRIVREMMTKYGPEWSYKNHNGNPAIDKGVLKAFGELKDKFIIWDRSDQSWRCVDADTLARLQERDAQRAERRAAMAAVRAERMASQV